MSDLRIDWPDAAEERVRAAQGRLHRAGEALRERSFGDRLEAVAGVLADWTATDSPWRRELGTALADLGPFTSGTVREGLDAALGAWSPEDFVRCAERELLADGRAVAPFEWTAVLAGGAIPMPTLLSGLLPLVLGSPVLLRETSQDPVTARVLQRSIAA